MIFKRELPPQFRDADADGLIGVRGYLNYFQDIASEFMYKFDKCNNVVTKKYNKAWIYTKYKLHIFEKAGFNGSLSFETWIEKSKSALLSNQALVISHNNNVLAIGRLESCVYDLIKHKPVRLSEIEVPTDIAEEKYLDLPAFSKISKVAESLEYVYSYHIRYTDIDNVGHMTNLKYVNVLLNAFEKKFYEENNLVDFEMNFVSQCYEGETLKVYKEKVKEGYRLLAMRENGEVVCVAIAEFTKN